jgi:hypothetical protein
MNKSALILAGAGLNGQLFHSKLPTGEKSKMYLDRLRDIKRQAKSQKRGAWAHSRE